MVVSGFLLTFVTRKEQTSMDLRYGVIGTGAVGGYYGGRLANGGKDVHFLLHRDYDFVRSNGLTVHSCNGDFALPHINAYHATQDMPPCDIIIVAMKTVYEDIVPDLVRPLLKETSIVLFIQNGIGVEEDVQRSLPGVQLAAGLAFICSAKTKPGVVNHQCYGSINIANYSCRDEMQLEQLVCDFRSCGVAAQQLEYQEARWKKAVWNMPFNGMTVVLNTQTDKLLRDPYTRALIRCQMMEIVNATHVLGVKNVDEAFVEKMLVTTDNMVPYSPSMKLDCDFHRPMELKYIYSRPLDIAQKAGCPMPTLRMLERELAFIQRSYSQQ